MEQTRRAERNRLYNELQTYESYIRVNEATIKRTRNLVGDVEFSMAKVTKLREKNKEYIITLEDLNKRLSLLSTGEIDQELIDNVKAGMDCVNIKNEEASYKRLIAKKEKEHKSKISKAFYKKTRESDRSFYRSKKEMFRSLKYFTKVCDSIPKYMTDKLRNMPNNKGYIWRGIYCYGSKRPERNKPTVMFEKKRGNILVIHEWYPSEYKRFEKVGKERKRLVEKYPRRKIVGQTPIF